MARSEFLQNASFYKKLQSNKNEKPPNKAQKSTTLTNQTDKTKKNTKRLNMYECHLQVLNYFINFELIETHFPSVIRLKKRSK